MAQAAKSQEPSMEEILASIRRIIAEDEPEKAQDGSDQNPQRLYARDPGHRVMR